MSSFTERLRKARQFELQTGGLTLILRRPTDAEAASLFKDDVNGIDVARDYVIDWKGVTEADLVTSGGSDSVPFSHDLWAEIIVDRPDLWAPISEAVTNAWVKHNEAREARSKN